MKINLNGPGGQLFGVVCMSFAAGALAIVAFERFLRNDNEWMVFAAVTVTFFVTISINAVRLRKAIPAQRLVKVASVVSRPVPDLSAHRHDIPASIGPQKPHSVVG